MATKTCSKCGIQKEVIHFGRHTESKDGLKSECKECRNREAKLYRGLPETKLKKEKYNKDNREKYREYKKKHYLENKAKYIIQRKEFFKKNVGKKKEYTRNQKAKNPHYGMVQYNKDPELFLKKKREKYHSNTEFRIRTTVSNRMRSFLKGRKDASIKKYIGCSLEELKSHLESQFKDGMSWSNYGEWHIDHKIPLKLFCLEREACLYTAFNYTNLQPLWATDNHQKSAKYVSFNS